MSIKFVLSAIYFFVALQANAANVVHLAKQPLTTLTSSDVLPNVLFVLDNSGSMSSTATPDWSAVSGDWLFYDSAFNTQAYNPEIRYIPANTFSGVPMPSQGSPWSAVFNDVTDTGEVSGGSVSLVNKVDYYATTAGEYCTSESLINCTDASAPSATYPHPAKLRWCSSQLAATSSAPASGTCRAIRSDGFIFMRSPVPKSFLTISGSGSSSIASISVNGKNIMSSSTGSSSSISSLLSTLASRINACASAISGNCAVSGHAAYVVNGSTLVITSNNQSDATVTPFISKSGSKSISATSFHKSNGTSSRVSVRSTTASYAKSTERSDCGGSTCSYANEMTNYANWYTYYRTRMQAMQTAASLAFSSIDARYRVGYITINNPSSASNFLPVAKFDTTQKKEWFFKLYSATPSGTTPLRQALSRAGQMYAGLWLNGGPDPVEYSCQQNFTVLTTDGYWNDSDSAAVKVDNSAMTNQDRLAPRPMYEGPTASANSLADVAKYYADTDLRTPDLKNCSGSDKSSVCGTSSEFPIQSMTTLTLGLGIDGTLLYSDNYKNQTSGTFVDITNGTANWTNPDSSEEAKIDDLWHAAVNANGTYYSAKNPQLLRESLIAGLQEIKNIVGNGVGAASRSLAPVPGNNLQFVASYTTGKWTGNLEARAINVATQVSSDSAEWCVEDVAASACQPGQTQEPNPAGGFYCVTPNSTESDCSDMRGALGAGASTTSCYVSVPSSCVGTLKSKVSVGSDSRNIFIASNNKLVPFSAANLPPDSANEFYSAFLGLSQFPAYSPTQKSLNKATVVSALVDYLRGRPSFEKSNAVPENNRLFRKRDAILGDITESRPVYFKESSLSYKDPGYLAYKSAQSSRQGVVFVGANDGMLHAFNADTGSELWAFIPSPAISKLPILADSLYATSHTNFVNGTPVVTDVCVAGCSSGSPAWRTVLIGGLNGGGRGYYALDVTNPGAPSLLWELTADSYNNLGFTFGNPVVSKIAVGGSDKWVALVATGLNNGSYAGHGLSNYPVGDGVGELLAIDIASGSIIKSISTGSGTSLSPSGLSMINALVDSPFTANKAKVVYGGDLNGDLWKFDLEADTASTLISAKSSAGSVQPITTAPEIGWVNSNPIILFGTGKYLETADISSTDSNSIYAVKDPGLTTPASRNQLAVHELSSAGLVRSTNTVSLSSTTKGWLVDLPSAERVSINPMLVNGVLLIPSMTPSSTSCLSGGFGWFNYFDYKTGNSAITGTSLASEYMNSVPVGLNLVYVKGSPKVQVSGSGSSTPRLIKQKDVAKGSSILPRSHILKLNSNGTAGKRLSVKELTD